MKKVFSAVLAIVTVFSIATTGYCAGTDAKTYSFYSDGMLFKQNEEAVIAGNAPTGSVITAELCDSDNKIVAVGECVTGSDGEFAVSFDAPAGGYEEYRIVLESDGVQFRTLENVVFGELWLASGQSNMQYPLAQDKVGAGMFENREKLSPWLRVLLVPAVNEYKGSTDLVPCQPQKDIAGAQWVTGENEAVYSMSAVAYFFAAEIMEELDMPVGVLNASLGGSVISSWLSRQAIESDEDVKNDLISCGEYYDVQSWNESERSIFYDMTANYNLKIEPLRHFRLSGMIWYQGESDVILGKTPEQYERMFDLMQRSYTETFDYKNGLLPIVYTQLAVYPYLRADGSDLQNMNIHFVRMQSAEADSRAVISVYDIPLTYLEEAGSIHPECKREIGERMAYSAKSLVYSQDNDYTAPMMKNAVVADGKIYVTIENAGDGLVCKGESLRGFAVADANGVFVQADAEIISNDTVVVYNEKITEPVAASYAYSLGNMRANLYASENGGIALPASPFVTNQPDNADYWYEKQWADCDSETVWHIGDGEYSAYYSAWTFNNASAEYDSESAYKGESGLLVAGNDTGFSLSPVLSARDGVRNVRFRDEDYDYSNYGSVSFVVRNNGDEDITFNGLSISTNAVTRFESADAAVVIPADGQWHEISVDINNLYLYGVDFGLTFSNDTLQNIYGIEFVFEGNDAVLSFDDVRFCPENEETEHNREFNIAGLSRLAEVVKMFICSVADYLKTLIAK